MREGTRHGCTWKTKYTSFLVQCNTKQHTTFPPVSPTPWKEATGDRHRGPHNSFPPSNSAQVYRPIGVCVCVCVQVAAVGKQWCGHSHAGSAHGSDKVPTEQFPPFSGRRWWTGRHRLKRAPRGSVQQGLGREAEKENQTGRGKEEDGVVRKRTG